MQTLVTVVGCGGGLRHVTGERTSRKKPKTCNQMRNEPTAMWGGSERRRVC